MLMMVPKQAQPRAYGDKEIPSLLNVACLDASQDSGMLEIPDEKRRARLMHDAVTLGARWVPFRPVGAGSLQQKSSCPRLL